MGLDMYLTAKLGISKYDKELQKKAEKIRKLFPEMFKSGNLDTVEVGFEVGYWRKSNHIHKWFVDNCQDGVDNCQASYVSKEDLEKLKDLCQKVLKDKKLAEEILPTRSGFFFGGVEYDECYYSDTEDTIKIINRCLELPDGWSFEYHASW